MRNWKFKVIFLQNILTKDRSEMKRTRLWVGHFNTISGHFFANYINSFPKTEVLAVILKCPTYSNLNWIKITLFFASSFLQFCKKKTWKFMTHKWPLYDYFWPFFRQLHKNLSQNWGLGGHFEVLTMSKSQLDQKLWLNMC